MIDDSMKVETLSGIAKRLGVSRSTVHRLAERDDAPKPVPWFKRRHWRVADWRAFMSTQAGQQSPAGGGRRHA